MEPNEIFERLKREIIWLDLQPESVLNLSTLAESFGVSRTPVKEALILLQGEGWVLRQESRFIVTPLAFERIREVTEIRSVVEVQSNVWAMQRMTEKDLAELRSLVDEIGAVGDKATKRQLVDLDFRFHRALYKATRNNQLAQMLERLLSHYLRFWLSLDRDIRPDVFFAETIDIVNGVTSRDETKVREASITHIRKSVNEIMGFS
jgi:GntR family transcriptional regulator, rspAB operon transcriptional repressor